MTLPPTPHPLSAYLESAIEAARLAGQVVQEGLGSRPADLQLEQKGEVNLVTRIDRLAEEAVIGHLTSRFPTHGIWSEEQGEVRIGSGLLWLVDPLDGTTNLAHGHPHCSVSIACLLDRRPVVAVVFDPMRDELFAATAGGGTRLNGTPIRVSDISILQAALLATGFPYDRQLQAGFYLRAVEAFLEVGQGIRRMGSAALDLAWLACGRLDGYWEPGLKPWDVAAGVLLVEEAGGRVTDYGGSSFDVLNPEAILASNGCLHPEMIRILQTLDSR
ncbi:MAG: inositol monophosphatase [Bradymonadales bacterium]|nr:inositol monophosphatase [Bradymonadales bacterium]